MSDTIDLLEAVGRDASLRRLPPDELAQRLAGVGASALLTSAAAKRDGGVLSQEFGTRVMGEPNSGNLPFRDEPQPLKVPFPGEPEDGDEPDGKPLSMPASDNVH